MNVLQRPEWRGGPIILGELFVLRKGRRQARCVLQTHVLGWELRLDVAGELVQSQVCRSQEDVLATGEHWKAAVLEKGWPSR